MHSAQVASYIRKLSASSSKASNGECHLKHTFSSFSCHPPSCNWHRCPCLARRSRRPSCEGSWFPFRSPLLPGIPPLQNILKFKRCSANSCACVPQIMLHSLTETVRKPRAWTRSLGLLMLLPAALCVKMDYMTSLNGTAASGGRFYAASGTNFRSCRTVQSIVGRGELITFKELPSQPVVVVRASTNIVYLCKLFLHPAGKRSGQQIAPVSTGCMPPSRDAAPANPLRSPRQAFW